MAKRQGLTIPKAIAELRQHQAALVDRIMALDCRVRTKRILIAYASGFTLKEIGEHYNISKQRVAKICKEIGKQWG